MSFDEIFDLTAGVYFHFYIKSLTKFANVQTTFDYLFVRTTGLEYGIVYWTGTIFIFQYVRVMILFMCYPDNFFQLLTCLGWAVLLARFLPPCTVSFCLVFEGFFMYYLV